jgi:ATP-dependent exoDNAse (exonuclease V) alpha subunit
VAQLVEITAIIETERWRNEDFVIAEARLVDSSNPDDPRTFSLKGNAPEGESQLGIEYRFYGTWDRTSAGAKRYGPSFNFKTFVVTRPVSPRGIIAYLTEAGKGLGIGPRTAEELFSKFRGKVLDVCREQPDAAAAAIPRVSAEAMAKLAERLREFAHVETAWIETKELLDGRGFPRDLAKKALQTWGNKAPAVISRDPYKLMAFRGVGFLKCDSFYKDLGLNSGALKRQAYCVAYEVASGTDGHTWIQASKAIARLKASVSGSHLEPEKAITLARRGKIIAVRVDERGNQWIADARDAAAEESVATRIALSASERAEWPMIPWSNDEDGLPTAHQFEELSKATAGTIGLFCGSPGSGKSFSLSFLLQEIIRLHGTASVAVAAPTGKAACRVNEFLEKMRIPLRATTVHSMLGVEMSDGEGWKFLHDEYSPLPCRYMVIDECFPAGTLIDTPNGKRTIESISAGDQIFNAVGIDSVVGISRKEVTRAIKINTGKATLFSSENHRFFTTRGVVFASDIRPGDSILQTSEAMRLLQDRNHPSELSVLEKEILYTSLQREMVDTVSGIQGQDPYKRESEEGRGRAKEISSRRKPGSNQANRANSATESHVESIHERRGFSKIERNRTQASDSRRKRTSNSRSSVTYARDTRKRVEIRGCNSVRRKNSRISDVLQGRYRQRDTETCDRMRRSVSLLGKGQAEGREERRQTSVVRVDSVEVLEQRHPELDQFRDASGSLYFYDIKAARHQSFSVEGMLVHNCSMLDVSLMSSILRARARGTHILFVGDPNQLPPVGRGAPLRDFIKAGLPYGELTEIHRNAGTIVRACHAIKNNRPFPTDTELAPDAVPPRNLKFIHTSNGNAASKLLELIESLKQSDSIDPVWDIQVLVAVNKKSPLSREKLNETLRPIFNPAGVSKGESPFKVNDKVMVTRNSFFPVANQPGSDDKKVWVANGELGEVLEAFDNRTIVEFENPKRVVLVPRGKQEKKKGAEDKSENDENAGTGCDMTLAYACTVHKCVHPDTFVETRRGLQRIQDIAESGIVGTHNGPKPYLNWVANPPSKCLEILTADGGRIIVTKDHGCEAWNGTEYVKRIATDLKIGDIVRQKLGMTIDAQSMPILPPPPYAIDARWQPCRIPHTMTEELAEFLGLMVADGTLRKNTMAIGKRHHDVTHRFMSLANHLFGVSGRTFETLGMLKGEIHSAMLATWLRRIGGMSPHDKHVPRCILESPLNIHKAFLRGLFEDGGVNINRRTNGEAGIVDHIEFTSASPAVIDAVRSMLFRIGIINGRLKTRYKTATDNRIYIYGQEVAKFASLIGFVSNYKNSLIANNNIRQTTRYRVPAPSGTQRSWFVNAMGSRAGASAFACFSRTGLITRSIAEKLAQSGNEWCQEMLQWHHSAITEIREIESPSMCIEVPDGNRFLQNGFPWFNCQGSSMPIAIVLVDEYPGATGSMGICDRNWLYTAISRAERVCYILGNMGTCRGLCRKIYIDRRKTFLAEDIRSHLQELGFAFPVRVDPLFDPAEFGAPCYEPIA